MANVDESVLNQVVRDQRKKYRSEWTDGKMKAGLLSFGTGVGVLASVMTGGFFGVAFFGASGYAGYKAYSELKKLYVAKQKWNTLGSNKFINLLKTGDENGVRQLHKDPKSREIALGLYRDINEIYKLRLRAKNADDITKKALKEAEEALQTRAPLRKGFWEETKAKIKQGWEEGRDLARGKSIRQTRTGFGSNNIIGNNNIQINDDGHNINQVNGRTIVDGVDCTKYVKTNGGSRNNTQTCVQRDGRIIINGVDVTQYVENFKRGRSFA